MEGGQAAQHPEDPGTKPHQKITAVIDAVLSYAATDDDWLRLAACIGSGGSAKQLAAIIDAVAAKPGPQSKIAMRNLIRRSPGLMERLFADKNYDALLHVHRDRAEPARQGGPFLSRPVGNGGRDGDKKHRPGTEAQPYQGETQRLPEQGKGFGVEAKGIG